MKKKNKRPKETPAPLQEAQIDTPAWKYGFSWFDPGTLLYLVGGVALVIIAIVIADHYKIGPKFMLDTRGLQTQGSVEQNPDGTYSLRYEHGSGTIHRQRYTEDLGVQRPDQFPGTIQIAYDPADPKRFQPLGVSYLPAAPVIVCFLAGMICVFKSRRMVHQRAKRDLPRK